MRRARIFIIALVMSWTAEPNRLISQVRLTPNRCLPSALIMKHLPLCQRVIVVGFVSDGVFQAAGGGIRNRPAVQIYEYSLCRRAGRRTLFALSAEVCWLGRERVGQGRAISPVHSHNNARLHAAPPQWTGGQPAGECRSFNSSTPTQRRDPPVD